MSIMTCCVRKRQGVAARDIADKSFAQQRTCIVLASSCTMLDMMVRKGVSLSPANLSCPLYRRMILRYSTAIVSLNLPESRCMPTKYIRMALYGNRVGRRSNGIRPLMAYVSPLLLPLGKSSDAFFGWLINKTNTQRTQMCRSAAGLLIHVLGKLAIAFITKFLTTDSINVWQKRH